jgi:hypothetical protein
LEAAKWAADRGVKVYTVGFGTKEGASIGFEGWSVYVRLDEETLKAIADTTRGEYFHAGTATDLKKVYQSLNARLVMERKETEVTFLFEALPPGCCSRRRCFLSSVQQDCLRDGLSSRLDEQNAGGLNRRRLSRRDIPACSHAAPGLRKKDEGSVAAGRCQPLTTD